MNPRMVLAFVTAASAVAAAAAVSWGQPTHLWMSSIFGAIGTASTALSVAWTTINGSKS